MARVLPIVCCSQCFCGRREQTYSVVDPSSDLFLVVQVWQVYARLTTAAVVVRFPMSSIASCYRKTHPRVQLRQHASIVNRPSHPSITDSNEPVIVLQPIWQPGGGYQGVVATSIGYGRVDLAERDVVEGVGDVQGVDGVVSGIQKRSIVAIEVQRFCESGTLRCLVREDKCGRQRQDDTE
jgi:hypothetical protein